MRKKITLKDIAKEIGVDISTVSKALRNSSDISVEMQQKVKATAEKLKYRPNLLAKNLINQKSNILGVIIPDLRISFFSEAVRGIYEEATKKGYESILMVHDEKSDNEVQKLEFLADIKVDGILLNAVDDKTNIKLYNSLHEEGIKIVCWDRKLADLNFNSVTIDDRKASFELTSKVISEGRKKIMFVGPTTDIPVTKFRFEGYLDALKMNGIQIRDELILKTKLRFESAHNSMLQALNKGIDFDAVICVGGLIAYGAGNAILESNRNIPDNIILGEFGDNDIIARLGVPFYTVNQSPYKIGKEAVNLLINCIENDNECQTGRHIVVNHEIKYRNIGIQNI